MSDQPALRLYVFWRSMATYRVRVGLNLKGVAVHEVPIDVGAGEQLSPDFLAVNPEGALPALVVSGGPAITQSIAILEYLEERWPEPPLLPADLRDRARVRSLAALIASDTHPLIVPRVSAYLTARAGFDEAAWRAWVTHWIGRGLTTMENRLAIDPATGMYSHGDQVTIADICLASLVAVATSLRLALPDTPTVARIVAACEKLDAFERARPVRPTGAA